MNRIADRQGEDKTRSVAPLLIIGIAIGLIFLPMACGMSAKVDFGIHIARPL